jgi:hypothetical protein
MYAQEIASILTASSSCQSIGIQVRLVLMAWEMATLEGLAPTSVGLAFVEPLTLENDCVIRTRAGICSVVEWSLKIEIFWHFTCPRAWARLTIVSKFGGGWVTTAFYYWASLNKNWRFRGQFFKEWLDRNQGDLTRLCKGRPKCCPIHFLWKLKTQLLPRKK